MFLIVDRFGRRPAMLIGSAGAIFAMYYLGIYSKLSNSFNEEPTRDAGAYFAIIMIYIFAIFYSISWNGIPWIFCAEAFPTAVRQVCLVFTTCTQWLGQFIIAYSTPYMVRYRTVQSSFRLRTWFSATGRAVRTLKLDREPMYCLRHYADLNCRSLI